MKLGRQVKISALYLMPNLFFPHVVWDGRAVPELEAGNEETFLVNPMEFALITTGMGRNPFHAARTRIS